MPCRDSGNSHFPQRQESGIDGKFCQKILQTLIINKVHSHLQHIHTPLKPIYISVDQLQALVIVTNLRTTHIYEFLSQVVFPT